jgi:hypothetical protein
MGTENTQAEQSLWVPLLGLLLPGQRHPSSELPALALVSPQGWLPGAAALLVRIHSLETEGGYGSIRLQEAQGLNAWGALLSEASCHSKPPGLLLAKESQ